MNNCKIVSLPKNKNKQTSPSPNRIVVAAPELLTGIMKSILSEIENQVSNSIMYKNVRSTVVTMEWVKNGPNSSIQ